MNFKNLIGQLGFTPTKVGAVSNRTGFIYKITQLIS